MYLAPDNFLYFIALFSVSIFLSTYLLFTYYINRLLVVNAIILFFVAIRVAVEFYIQSISTFEELQTFLNWQGYGLSLNIIVSLQWSMLFYYIRPLRGVKYEKWLNYLFVWGLVIIPFVFHSYYMFTDKLFQYNPERIDNYWKFTMNTGFWYFPIYNIHTKLSILFVIISLFVGIVRNKKNRLLQSFLLMSYMIIPFMFFAMNAPSKWNVPNVGILFVVHSIIISWYVSNYRLLKSNIGLISKDLFNSITDLTISTDANFKITNVNNNASEFFKIKTKNVVELLKKNLLDQSLDLDKLVSKSLFDPDEEVEFDIYNKKLEPKTLKLKVAPFKNDEQLLGYTFLFSDLTDLRNQEKKLQELNNTKDTLFQIIGHEMKKPSLSFRNVSKNINYLVDKGDYIRLKSLGQEVAQEAKSLYNLTDNLLNWALVQKDSVNIKPEQVSVDEIIKYNIDLFQNIANQKKIEVSENTLKGLEVYTDRNSLDTVIRNLFDNALKFSPIGGYIKFEALQLDDKVQISITDDGKGIDKNLIEKLSSLAPIESERGTQEEKGSGIGLKLVYRLLDKNNGRIILENGQYQGTTMIVELPVAGGSDK